MRRIAVRGIAVRDNKLLCVRHKMYTGNIVGKDFWCLPGGTVDEGENLTAAITREMIEETAITPLIGKLLYINHFQANNMEHLEFFFHVKNPEDYREVDLSKASHAEEEIAEIDFIDTTKNNVLPEFLTTKPANDLLTANAEIISSL
ncbi:MAG: NUDIX hydrolase [Candidatus Saccharibacteria bacterium]|nr:NUDIX hydrolase [Candidatus Saccharibacteria bacterium]